MAARLLLNEHLANVSTTFRHVLVNSTHSHRNMYLMVSAGPVVRIQTSMLLISAVLSPPSSDFVFSFLIPKLKSFQIIC